MKITFKELKSVVRGMLSEAEEGEGKKKEKKAIESPFSCPRHHQGLVPVWRRIKVADTAVEVDPSVQPYGPLEPGQSRQIIAPTSKFTAQKQPRVTKSIIQNWICPLWEEDGPYAYDPETKKGHACDFRVSARVTRPGQKNPHEARGQVAEEEGVLFKPIKPRESTPTGQAAKAAAESQATFEDMVNTMEAKGFRWKKVQGTPTKGKPTPATFTKVPAKASKRFTGDDVQFLSFYYPKRLSDAKNLAGNEYKGPAPYFMSADKVVRALLKMGWDYVEPETKERKVTGFSKKSIPTTLEPQRSVTATMTKGKGKGPAPEEPWYGSDDDDDPWDEDTDVDIEDKGEEDDDDTPERWKV